MNNPNHPYGRTTATLAVEEVGRQVAAAAADTAGGLTDLILQT